MKGAVWRAEVGTPFSLFRAACPGALPPGLVWLFLAWLGVLPWGLRPRASRWARLQQPPNIWISGVEVGANLVHPLV